MYNGMKSCKKKNASIYIQKSIYCYEIYKRFYTGHMAFYSLFCRNITFGTHRHTSFGGWSYVTSHNHHRYDYNTYSRNLLRHHIYSQYIKKSRLRLLFFYFQSMTRLFLATLVNDTMCFYFFFVKMPFTLSTPPFKRPLGLLLASPAASFIGFLSERI